MAGLFIRAPAWPSGVPRRQDRFPLTGYDGYTLAMGQESDFDIERFEQRVDSLLAAYQRLQDDYRKLQAARNADIERNGKLRERLNGVIERIRALEAEADNA